MIFLLFIDKNRRKKENFFQNLVIFILVEITISQIAFTISQNNKREKRLPFCVRFAII